MGETLFFSHLRIPLNWIKQAAVATFNFIQAKLNCSLNQYGIQDSQGLLEHARIYVRLICIQVNLTEKIHKRHATRNAAETL